MLVDGALKSLNLTDQTEKFSCGKIWNHRELLQSIMALAIFSFPIGEPCHGSKDQTWMVKRGRG